MTENVAAIPQRKGVEDFVACFHCRRLNSHNFHLSFPSAILSLYSSHIETSNTCHWNFAVWIGPPLATVVAVRDVSVLMPAYAPTMCIKYNLNLIL
jgi:hypothetical protein